MQRRHLIRRVADEAALVLALAASACAARDISLDGGETGDGPEGGDGDGNFELVSARLDATREVVILTFSKAVGPVDQVDPADFRISYAQPEALCGGQGCTDITTYRDPNFFVSQYWNYDGLAYAGFDIDELTPGAQATEVILRATAPLEPQLCEAIDYFDMYSAMSGSDYDVGLFVHHSAGAIPLDSADGEPLDSFGAQWVGQALPVWYTEGDYPNLDPKVEIPCDI